MAKIGKRSSTKSNNRSGSYVIGSAVGGRPVVEGSKSGKSAVIRDAIRNRQTKRRSV